MTMATKTTTTRLVDIMSRLKAQMRAADTGPLIVAEEIMQLDANWHLYKVDAGGLDCSCFLRREFGRGRDLSFFQRRAEAVKKLGEAVRRKLHHDVAVWLAAKIEGEEQIKKAAWALMSAANQQNGNCLTLAQAKPVVLKALGVKLRPKPKAACTRCAELERLLKDHGIEVK